MRRNDVVEAGLSLIGVPFKWQGNDPAVGVDCRGFLRATLDRLGYALGYDRTPNYSHGKDTHILYECMKEIMDEVAVEESQAGDFPLFRMMNDSFHVGMWSRVDPFWIVQCHALTETVVETPLDRRAGRLLAVFRLRGLMS